MQKYTCTNTDLLCVRQELQQVFEQLRSIDLASSLSYVFHNGVIRPARQLTSVKFNGK